MSRFGMLAWLAVALAACGSLELAPPTREAAPLPERVVSTGVRIAQSDHGAAARFMVCRPPHCPTPTRKTLAMAPAGNTPALPLAASDPSPVRTPPSRTRDPDPAFITVVAHFSVGSAALTRDARQAIDAAVAAALPVRRVQVVARTDASGSASLNHALASARADAVSLHLRTRHPELLARLVVDARGRCCYAAPNHTAAGRAANRRAEVTFETDGDDL
jgi:peptidoglycan-binding protein ArfA